MLVAVSRKDLMYPITQCHEHVTCVHYVVCWISFSSRQLFIFCCQLTHRSVSYTHVVSAPSSYPVHNPLLLVFITPNVMHVWVGSHKLMWWTIRFSRGSIHRSTSVIPFDSAAWWDRPTMYAAIAGLYDGVVYSSTLVIGARSNGIEVWPMTALPLRAVTLRLLWVAKVAKSIRFCNDFCNIGCKMTIKYHSKDRHTTLLTVIYFYCIITLRIPL